jgi:antitoxin CptB
MPPDQDTRTDPDAVGRLKWRCRRGMRELDALLEQFLAAEAQTFGAADIACLSAVLDLPDPELHAYLVGRSAPADPDLAALIARIRASVRSGA